MLKRIGNTVYAHKSNLDELKKDIGDKIFNQIKECLIYLPKDFMFDVIKLDKKSNKVSFISSPDWDISREPLVGDSYCINLSDENKSLKLIKSKGQIYHHKWMFVSDTYSAFNLEEAKAWSAKWTEVFPKDRLIKSRIGYKKYWEEYLILFNLDS